MGTVSGPAGCFCVKSLLKEDCNTPHDFGLCLNMVYTILYGTKLHRNMISSGTFVFHELQGGDLRYPRNPENRNSNWIMNWCNRLLDGEFLSKKSFPLTRTKQGLPMIVHWRHSFITVPHVAFAYDDTSFFQS